MPFDASRITAFTLIAAPAVLTIAADVLTLSTRNRFNRTLDRARNLAKQLESGEVSAQQRQTTQFDRAQVHSFLVLRALYLSLATFAATKCFPYLAWPPWPYSRLNLPKPVPGLLRK